MRIYLKRNQDSNPRKSNHSFDMSEGLDEQERNGVASPSRSTHAKPTCRRYPPQVPEGGRVCWGKNDERWGELVTHPYNKIP